MVPVPQPHQIAGGATESLTCGAAIPGGIVTGPRDSRPRAGVPRGASCRPADDNLTDELNVAVCHTPNISLARTSSSRFAADYQEIDHI